MKSFFTILFSLSFFASVAQCDLEVPPTIDFQWYYWMVPNPILQDQDIHICPASYVQLSVNINSPYQFTGVWNDGNTLLNTVPVNSGSYFYTLTNINGCVYVTPVATVFNDASEIQTPLVGKNGCEIKCLSPIAETYRWYRNGNVIAGATDYLYQPIYLGKYKCRITSGGCYADSKEVKVTSVCGERVADSEISIEVFDLAGRRVYSGFSIPDYLIGVYFVRYSGVDYSFTEKVLLLSDGR